MLKRVPFNRFYTPAFAGKKLDRPIGHGIGQTCFARARELSGSFKFHLPAAQITLMYWVHFQHVSSSECVSEIQPAFEGNVWSADGASLAEACAFPTDR
jgi:hypothetical protein